MGINKCKHQVLYEKLLLFLLKQQVLASVAIPSLLMVVESLVKKLIENGMEKSNALGYLEEHFSRVKENINKGTDGHGH